MLLHGHTRESIDAISASDKAMIYAHCHPDGACVVGPLAPSLIAYRLSSRIRALQGTVLSLVPKNRPPPPLDFYNEFPEAARVMDIQPKVMTLEDQMERLAAEFEGD